eukprot:jgi/Mesvir1/11643/Mv00044-RA.1
MTARSRRCGSVTRAGRRCLRSCTGGRVRCPVHRLAVYNTRGGREEQAREDGEDSRRRALARLEEMRRSRNSSASYDPGPSTRTKPTLGAPPGPGPEQTLWDRMMGEPERLRNKRSADMNVDRATDRLTNAKRRAGREWEWRPGARRPTFGDLQQHDAITRAIAEGLDTRSAIRFGSTSRKNNLVTSQVLKGRFAAAADRAQKRATQKMPGF